MPIFTDQIGHSITLDQTPRRIISLVPSQTELLYTLGLDQQVLGITKFCVHPASWFRTKTRIGGTKDIHPEIIAALKPDLIIAGKEENVRPQVEALMPQYPVWTSDVRDLPSALDMIRSIGALTGTVPAATTLATEIAHRFSLLSSALTPQSAPSSPPSSAPQALSASSPAHPEAVPQAPSLAQAPASTLQQAGAAPQPQPAAPSASHPLPSPAAAQPEAAAQASSSPSPAQPRAAAQAPAPRTAYLIWRNPYMAAGGDTFIHDMLTRAGLKNVFADLPRYPSLTPDTLKNLDTRLILLSSEPYPFREKHIAEIQSHLPHTRILLVDGELFSWYGSRLLQTPAYLQTLTSPVSPQSAQNVDL